MIEELNNYLWPTLVSVAFIFHYFSSCLNSFKEAQDSALEDYASKANTTFTDRAALEKYIRNNEQSNDYKIPISSKEKDTYVRKFLAFAFFGAMVFIAAIIQTSIYAREASEQKRDEFLQIAEQHHNIALKNLINKNYAAANAAANHMLIAFICFTVLGIVFLVILFIAYKYLKPTDKISGINSPFLKRVYEWMPYADEFAFAVVICEFALFWVEKFK